MLLTHHFPIILASGSVNRQQMLKSVGLQFSVEVSGVDEDALKRGFALDMHPVEKGLALARAKTLAVSARYPDAYTIGGDQICALTQALTSPQGGEEFPRFIIFDKPGSHSKAEAQLAQLAGRTHQQHSAVVLAKGAEIVWETVATATLTMRPLTAAQIHTYVAADAPIAAAGAYHFEALGRHLFASVEGDAEVIQGLPLTALVQALHTHGVIAITG